MALTKVSRGLLSTGIVDNSNTTAITLNADESATFAGNVGIGGSTITDVNLLNIQGSGASKNIGVVFNDTNTSKIFAIQNGGSALKFFDYTASAERMRIDSAGNLGVGVSPAAWNSVTSGRTAVQVGFGSIAGRLNDIQTEFTNNAYAVGTGNTPQWAGITRWSKNQIAMASDGSIVFNNAPTVSQSTFDASPNFTWQERMRIDSSGSLRINNTRTTATKLHIVGGTASGTMYDTAVFAGGQNSTSGSGARIYLSGCENDPISRGTIIAGQMTDNGNSHALIFSTSGNSQAPAERMRIGSDGTTGFFGAGANTRSDITMTVTTSDSSKRWGFGGGATGNSAVFYVINESNVGVYMGHGGQSWIAHSDERIKENITDVGTVLPSLMNMRCVKYNLISNPSDTKIGFIAQDWQSAFPEVVDENEHLVLEDDGTVGTDDDSDSTTPVKAMAYTETIPLLLKAIQEQQATIESQAAAITDLTTRLTALENQ